MTRNVILKKNRGVIGMDAVYIIVFIMILFLFAYCMTSELSAFDTKNNDKAELKIEKKEGKDKDYYIDSLRHIILQYNRYDYVILFSCTNTSFIFSEYARPPLDMFFY